jgi:hypothetical protein
MGTAKKYWICCIYNEGPQLPRTHSGTIIMRSALLFVTALHAVVWYAQLFLLFLVCEGLCRHSPQFRQALHRSGIRCLCIIVPIHPLLCADAI